MGITNKFKQNTNQSITLLLLIGILIVVNIFSYQLFFRWDLTENKIFSISSVSKDTVAELQDVVNIKAYFSDNLPSQYITVKQEVADLLDEYRNYSKGKVNIQFINPGEDETIKQQLYMIGIPQVTFQIFEKDKASVANGYMGIAISYEDKNEVIPVVKREMTDLEYQITTAIKKVTTVNMATIGYLTSQGATGLDNISEAKKGIEELYTLQEFSFDKAKTIPETISTLIIAGPKEKFTDEQLKELNNFMVRGGAIMALVDGVNIGEGLSAVKNETGLEKLFVKYGIKLNQDVVGDIRNGVASFSQGFFSFSTNYPYWPKITNEGFDKDNNAVSSLENVVLPWVASIDIDENVIDKNAAARLAITTDQAWQLTDNFNIAPNTIEPAGAKKHFTLAMLVNGTLKSAYPAADKKAGDDFTGRLALVGDSDFINNGFAQGVPDNLIFFQNLVDSLSLSSDLITIRSKGIGASQIKEGISEGQKIAFRYFNIFGMTLIIVGFGLFRYFARRRSRFVDDI
jgi:gliding-associated putative ABC transporter substrate-binding component GldG